MCVVVLGAATALILKGGHRCECHKSHKASVSVHTAAFNTSFLFRAKLLWPACNEHSGSTKRCRADGNARECSRILWKGRVLHQRRQMYIKLYYMISNASSH
eukprot:5376-Heterococcus_DN1.PRE.2